MTAKIIDGKSLAQKIRAELAAEIEASGCEDMPVLAVVAAGENEASQIYIRNKKKAATAVGIGCEVFEFSGSIGENALISSVEELNNNPHINGIIVQQPLPKQINPLKVLEHISAIKDVDGFSETNVGKLMVKEPDAVISATPKGILELIKSTGESLAGKHAVIIGRSNIVGRPLAMLLLNHDCTVTVCHSKTQNLADICSKADILVAACGCPKMVQKDWVKPGAIVIDVGINRVEGKLCGDVNFEEVSAVAGYITPVPGGVGPMTIAMLLQNTWEAAQKQAKCHCHHTGQTCSCGHHRS